VRRHDDAGHAERRRDLCGVERTGAAERHELEVARVDAALNGDAADRARHALVRDLDHRTGGGDGAEPDPRAQDRERLARPARVELQAAV
jgi:hypothetical protein